MSRGPQADGRRGVPDGFGSWSAVSRRVVASYRLPSGDAREATIADCRVQLGSRGGGNVPTK